jgi:hypothetical protein
MTVPNYIIVNEVNNALLNQEGSIVDEAYLDPVEEVIAQYHTTLQQKRALFHLLRTCSREKIPIEWIVQIADDENNRWFYATAYHYNDHTQTLHVVIPDIDEENYCFEIYVQLDHHIIHLVDCVDEHSRAIFNKIVRDSIIKVKWSLKWFFKESNGSRWISSKARYYIPILNHLFIEDRRGDLQKDEFEAFVSIIADTEVELHECLKGEGSEEFCRLIKEKIVRASPGAIQFVAGFSTENSRKIKITQFVEELQEQLRAAMKSAKTTQEHLFRLQAKDDIVQKMGIEECRLLENELKIALSCVEKRKVSKSYPFVEYRSTFFIVLYCI